MALSEELSAKILALIEAEGAGEHDTDTSDEGTPPEKDTSSMRAVRAQAKRLEKELKEREAELASLREYRDTTEARRVNDLLLASGLSPTQAEVFIKAGFEATPDAVASFKASVLGVENSGDAGTQSPPTFQPTGWVGEQSQKVLTAKDLASLTPEQRAKALAEGRVAFRSLQQ